MIFLQRLLEVTTGNMTAILVVVVLGLLVYRYLRPSPWHLPPSRTPWPVIGNVNIKLNETSEKRLWRTSLDLNSSIISQWLGPMYMIVMHKYEDIKEVFSLDEFSGRNEALFKGPLKGYVFNGLFNTEGDRWKEQRKFTLTTLKSFGLGTNKIERKIQEEVNEMVKEFDKTDGKPYDLQHLLNTSVSNIICSLVFGQRFDYSDEQFQTLMSLTSENTVNFRRAIVGSMIPGAKYVPGDIFCIQRLKRNIDKIRELIIRPECTKHQNNYDENNIDDYIDAFLKEMYSRKGDKNHWFTEEQLLWNIEDLFAAGTETTATSLRWAFLCMLKYPEVQDKVRAEINEVIGMERAVSMHDKLSLPYTEATLLEIQRACTVTSLGPPHCTFQQPVKFKDYLLPPRTNVFANFYAVNNDPDHWGDPDVFRPDRFIHDNKFKPDDHVMTFSVGKRSCIGESLARMELFVFFTSIIQKYTLRLPDGDQSPSMARVPGIAIGPKSYRACFIRN